MECLQPINIWLLSQKGTCTKYSCRFLVFCCVGSLAVTGSLHHVDKDLLGWWLCERQIKSGGLNGRPEKLPDVCYSWWVLSSLIMIERVHWIDKENFAKFILDCRVTSEFDVPFLSGGSRKSDVNLVVRPEMKRDLYLIPKFYKNLS
ncbi:hypothetical protein POM88_049062 [Heracleum sosnowskyi]|uniref:Geranylgeranyl transferase type II subunit beta n=1 Tax=Heracleum sosnowskyi TaxID=360622 RepID=A0AAD8GWA5_9APIA|nr:hypothetical protein POM88_049062 [Heracleum sosnowskyi]